MKSGDKSGGGKAYEWLVTLIVLGVIFVVAYKYTGDVHEGLFWAFVPPALVGLFVVVFVICASLSWYVTKETGKSLRARGFPLWLVVIVAVPLALLAFVAGLLILDVGMAGLDLFPGR